MPPTTPLWLFAAPKLVLLNLTEFPNSLLLQYTVPTSYEFLIISTNLSRTLPIDPNKKRSGIRLFNQWSNKILSKSQHDIHLYSGTSSDSLLPRGRIQPNIHLPSTSLALSNSLVHSKPLPTPILHTSSFNKSIDSWTPSSLYNIPSHSYESLVIAVIRAAKP